MCHFFQENSPTGCIQRWKMTSDEENDSKPLLELSSRTCPSPWRNGPLLLLARLYLVWNQSLSCTEQSDCRHAPKTIQSRDQVAFWRSLTSTSPSCAAQRSCAKPNTASSRSRKPWKIQVEPSQCEQGSFRPLGNRFTVMDSSYGLYKTHLGPSHPWCCQAAAGEPWIWGSCTGLPPSSPTLPDPGLAFSP